MAYDNVYDTVCAIKVCIVTASRRDETVKTVN